MIKSITGGGRYLTVSGGGANTYINSYSGLQGVGNMRFNTSNQCMEVFDGNGWQMIAMDHATVTMSPDAELLLDWARKKRDEEMMWAADAQKSQAVKKALETFEKARSELDLISKLSREYDTTS